MRRWNLTILLGGAATASILWPFAALVPAEGEAGNRRPLRRGAHPLSQAFQISSWIFSRDKSWRSNTAGQGAI